jgi:hypothetical protein
MSCQFPPCVYGPQTRARHPRSRSVSENPSLFSYVRLDNTQRPSIREPCGEATYRRREAGSSQVVAEFFLHISLRRGPARGLRAIPSTTVELFRSQAGQRLRAFQWHSLATA